MKKIDFFKEKCQILESFYDWLEYNRKEGVYDYGVAGGQTVYYGSMREDGLEDIILYITVGILLARYGKEYYEHFREDLEDTIAKYKALDIEEYTLSEEEKNIFVEEVKTIETLLQK